MFFFWFITFTLVYISYFLTASSLYVTSHPCNMKTGRLLLLVLISLAPVSSASMHRRGACYFNRLCMHVFIVSCIDFIDCVM